MNLQSTSSCHLCEVKFKRAETYHQHVINVHYLDLNFIKNEFKISQCNHECSECKKQFATESSLDYHTRLHIKNACKTCHLCYSVLSDSSSLNKHFKNIHAADSDMTSRKLDDSELILSCPSCEKRFARESFLNYHIKLKHSETKKCNSNRSTTCHLCHSVSSDRSNLLKHFRTVHAADADMVKRKMVHGHRRSASCSVIRCYSC